MALLSGSEAIQKVIEILTREIDEENSYRMLSDMVNGATRQGIRFNTALQLLEKLLQGIQDNRQSL